MKIALATLVVALGLAAVLSVTDSAESFDERLIRLEAKQALPELAPALASESAPVNALFLDYADTPALWMSAQLAILNHGEVAREVLLAHGLEPAFQQVLSRLGADAVLPVGYYREHDIATVRAQHWLGERYRSASQALDGWFGDGGFGEDQAATDGDGQASNAASQATSAEPTALTPQRRGQIAVATLKRDGHDFLREFVVGPEGEVTRLQSERLVSDVGDFFTGGVRNLESQWRRGETIDAADIGWAGVDLLVMGSAVKVLRAGRAARVGAAAEGQGARLAAVDAIAGSGRFATLSRTARVAAVMGTAYVVIEHPSLVGALGANLAGWLGWPAWLGQFLLWTIVLLPLLIVARFLYVWVVAPMLWLLVPLLRATSRVPRWMVRRQPLAGHGKVEGPSPAEGERGRSWPKTTTE
ncbi:hypothetical protein [Salinicola halophilus]|uniref:hypothetical protein n=1 Tax=Salinicola halophilus TaxID=184065 RepID=UPI0019550BA6|nr:hypothetical protein [Salinicola halophilus]